MPPDGMHTAVWIAVGSGTVCSLQSFQRYAGVIVAAVTSRLTDDAAGAGPAAGSGGAALLPSPLLPAVRYTTPAAVAAAIPAARAPHLPPRAPPGVPQNNTNPRVCGRGAGAPETSWV